MKPKFYLLSAFLFLFLFPLLSSAQILCQRQLVWHDEFSTPGNLSLWKVYTGDGCNETSGCGFGNSELELYRAANAVVADSVLTIIAKHETVVNPVDNKTFNYTSAKLMSKLTGSDTVPSSFQYGRFEARIQLPSAGGAWPAFWMLNTAGGWPNTGEIDIMEAKNKNPMAVNGTIHYAFPAGVHQSSGSKLTSTVDLSTGFHVYAVEWSPYQINWFVDDSLYFTQTPATTVGGSWPFDASKMYILLNVAVGGPNTGFTGKVAPNPADYPATMVVDYVRVYKGIYNYAVFGKNAVYPNETFQDYRIDTVSGASYSWSVPSGASILSGQGTNLITVNWGTTGGNVAVTLTSPGCAPQTFTRAVTIKQPLVLDKVYEDFEANRLSYGPFTGALQQAVANPSPGRVDVSSLVGKYVRNAASQFDDIYISNLPVPNAMDFVLQRKKFFLDVYTTAPVGSEVDLQLENGTLSLVNAFPSGRHSKYVTHTTRQNSWETLEFDYNQTIANSGTGIFDINKVVLLMEPNLLVGDTWYFDNLRVMEQPSVTWKLIAADTLENYDGASIISFDPSVTSGVYTPGVANPSATGINLSAHAASYKRDSASAFDELSFSTGGAIPSASPFILQEEQFQLDIYTSAPPGTPVSINLQNKALAALAYPSGRNSSYQAVTTKQNQWETLTFYFASNPKGASDLAIDQLLVLFSPNLPVAQTYYIDNIRAGKKVLYKTGAKYLDYDTTNLLSFRQSDGVYQANAANPGTNSINSSALTGKYTRNSAAPFDVLSLGTAAIKNGYDFKQGVKLFAMDLYTTAPAGTPISWQLQSSVKTTATNYPAGRHSTYQGKVGQTNAWHTVYFYLGTIDDPATLDSEVDNVALLFASNSADGHIYYIDNLRYLGSTTSADSIPAVPDSSLPAPWQHQDIGAVAATGNAFYTNSIFTVKASGSDIWNAADEFHFVYQPLSGDGSIVARVDSLANTNAAAKACVMIRETMIAGSIEVSTMVKAGGGTEMAYRSATGGATNSVNTSGNPPKWLKLVRAGNVFTSSISNDGITWTRISSKTVTMASQAQVGFGATSHSDGVITTARFSQVAVTTGTTPSAISPLLATAEGVGLSNTPLQVYPNPAHQSMQVSWISAANLVEIGDINGRVLRRLIVAPAQRQLSVDVSGLAPGVYILTVRSQKEQHTFKFIKE